MKKFLLSLFAILTATTMFALSDTLNKTNFKASGSGYSAYTYYSESTKVTYSGNFNVDGENICINKGVKSSKYCSFLSTSNPQNLVIKSITLTYANTTSLSITVRGNNSAYTVSGTEPGGDEVATIAMNTQKEYLADFSGKNYTHFAITSSAYAKFSSIVVEYVDASDDRTDVTLSFPQTEYEVNLGEDFTAPELTCEPAAALSEIVYESSNVEVATVDNSGNVTVVAAGETKISASISTESETYKPCSAEYTLKVVDPDALIPLTLNVEFFGNVTNSYDLVTDKEDPNYGFKYSAVYSNNNGMISFNLKNTNGGAGSGLYVSYVNPEYLIKSIEIDFNNARTGVLVYTKDCAFPNQTEKSTPVSTDGASLVSQDAISTLDKIFINAPAFAILPTGDKAISINSITVTYAKAESDGSVVFSCEAFKDYTLLPDELTEFTLPEGAPAITFTSSNEDVAIVDEEDGKVSILAGDPGTATITASWDAVATKWYAGTATFKVTVPYANLASMLENPVKGETYLAGFPVVVASRNGDFTYVTDGTDWTLFYGSSFAHENLNVIPAGWSGKYTISNGRPEFQNVTHTATGDLAGYKNIVFKESADMTITEAMENQVVILDNVTFDSATPAKGTFKGTYNDTEYTFYNEFGGETTAAGTYNVKAAIGYYNGLQIWPIEYIAAGQTTAAPSHDSEKKYNKGETVAFTANEGRILYCHVDANDPENTPDPSHNNVFVEIPTENPANAPMKVLSRAEATTPGVTYNHETHPLTFNGEEINVKYVAKAEGKAPSAVQTLAIDGEGNTTGIADIVVDSEANGTVEFYNLQGQRVMNPASGLYIMRQGTTVKKVIL